MRFPWWPRRDRRAQLEEEIRGHLAMAAQDRADRGESAPQSRQSARKEFGNVALVTEVTRDQWRWNWVADFGPDLRYAVRVLRKSPGFTAIIVLTVALGIGANAAVFSLINAFLLRELPVNSPQELVVVHATRPTGGTSGDFSLPAYEALRDRNHSLSGVFAWDNTRVGVTAGSEPEFLDGDFVSGSYWNVLGVRALVGRLFSPDDDAPGKKPVAVISYTYWQRRFTLDPSVLGRTIYVGRAPFTVIGVTSPRFFGRNTAGVSADIVLPMAFQRELGLKDHDTFEVMGRLMPDVASEEARADLTVVYQQELMRQAGTQNSRQTDSEVGAQKIVLTPAAHGTSLPTDNFSRDVRILAAVVGVALLIACVNVAGLLVARGSGRRKEIAIRQAIGASRERLIRQLLVESFVLAGLGGLLGLLFANWGVSILLGLLVTDGSPLPQAGLDLWTVAFAVTASLLTGLFFGLGSAFIGTRVGLNAVLKGSDERAGSRGNSGRRLAISQVALSLSLLIGAGLLLRSLQHLYEVQTGFEREAVVQTWVFPVLSGYGHAEEMNLYPRLLEKFSAIPGVRSASVSRLRMIYGHWYRDVWTQNTGADARESLQVYCDPVGPRFFETMGIPLVGGREFSVADTETSMKVAIISESMAKRFYPEGNPIGRRFRFDAQPGKGEVEVVGVVRDIRHRMDSAERPESAWIPYTQSPAEMLGQMNFLIRTAVAPPSILPSMREQARSVAANLPLAGLETQAAEVDEYLAGRRSMATLLTAFAALALGLASIGLYGTISYGVRARTRELGIRFALGAQGSEILWMVLRETLGLTAIGVAIGVPLALVGTRLVASMLFGVKATDATTISFAVLIMCATALLAGYLPARRATRVDPLVALRYE